MPAETTETTAAVDDYERWSTFAHLLNTDTRRHGVVSAIRSNDSDRRYSRWWDYDVIDAFVRDLRDGRATSRPEVDQAAADALDVPLSVFMGDPQRVIDLNNARRVRQQLTNARRNVAKETKRVERLSDQDARVVGALDDELRALIETSGSGEA